MLYFDNIIVFGEDYMLSKKSFLSVVIGFFLMGNIGYAWYPYPGHHSASSFVAGMIVGSAIKGKHYKKRRYKSKKHRTKRKKSKKRTIHVMSNQQKIQKSLLALGFYHGAVDGEVNSYETRSAIKAMNQAYHIDESASLMPKTKDTLIYLGDLFIFDRILISKDTHKKAKSKKIQVALKIHGFYHDKIDGLIGSGTRKNISEYKESKGLSEGSALDFEEEYQLLSSAKILNDKNIDDAIASLEKKKIEVKEESPLKVNVEESNLSAVIQQ